MTMIDRLRSALRAGVSPRAAAASILAGLIVGACGVSAATIVGIGYFTTNFLSIDHNSGTEGWK